MIPPASATGEFGRLGSPSATRLALHVRLPRCARGPARDRHRRRPVTGAFGHHPDHRRAVSRRGPEPRGGSAHAARRAPRFRHRHRLRRGHRCLRRVRVRRRAARDRADQRVRQGAAELSRGPPRQPPDPPVRQRLSRHRESPGLRHRTRPRPTPLRRPARRRQGRAQHRVQRLLGAHHDALLPGGSAEHEASGLSARARLTSRAGGAADRRDPPAHRWFRQRCAGGRLHRRHGVLHLPAGSSTCPSPWHSPSSWGSST